MTKVIIENSAGEVMKELDVEVWKVLLSQLEAAWVDIPNACRAGMCAACMCHIKNWEDSVNKSLRWEPAFPLGDNEIMTCIWWVEQSDEPIILQTMY